MVSCLFAITVVIKVIKQRGLGSSFLKKPLFFIYCILQEHLLQHPQGFLFLLFLKILLLVHDRKPRPNSKKKKKKSDSQTDGFSVLICLSLQNIYKKKTLC